MTGPLSVLMVDSETTWRGGENQAWLLARGLRRRGHRVGFVAPPGSAILARLAGVDVERVAIALRGAVDPLAAWRLRRAIRAGGWDVVHAHASHAHTWMALACAGMRRPPLRVVSRRVDFPVSTRGGGAWKYRRGADLFLAISSAVERELLAGGVDGGRIRRVPSGVDAQRAARRRDRASVRRELGLDPAEAVVGTVAALAPHKALHHLVDAAAVLAGSRRVRVLIVGEGTCRPELERRIARSGLGDVVTLLGHRDDAVDVLGAFDVFAMPSELEGLCTSILDAQLCGVPVVASAAGGIVDIVRDGETGLLVPPGDAAALAAAITRVLDDRALARRLAERAAASAAAYDWTAMVERTEAAYREALAARA